MTLLWGGKIAQKFTRIGECSDAAKKGGMETWGQLVILQLLNSFLSYFKNLLSLKLPELQSRTLEPQMSSYGIERVIGSGVLWYRHQNYKAKLKTKPRKNQSIACRWFRFYWAGAERGERTSSSFCCWILFYGDVCPSLTRGLAQMATLWWWTRHVFVALRLYVAGHFAGKLMASPRANEHKLKWGGRIAMASAIIPASWTHAHTYTCIFRLTVIAVSFCCHFRFSSTPLSHSPRPNSSFHIQKAHSFSQPHHGDATDT